jgi:hypothetical protein
MRPARCPAEGVTPAELVLQMRLVPPPQQDDGSSETLVQRSTPTEVPANEFREGILVAVVQIGSKQLLVCAGHVYSISAPNAESAKKSASESHQPIRVKAFRRDGVRLAS